MTKYPYKFRKGKIIKSQLLNLENLNDLNLSVEIKENFLSLKTYKTIVKIDNFDEMDKYQIKTPVKFWTDKNKVISLSVL